LLDSGLVAVLLRVKTSGLLDEYPNLSAYVARGEARPAYKRAFDAQLTGASHQAVDEDQRWAHMSCSATRAGADL
jgi:glutathione S-transferase